MTTTDICLNILAKLYKESNEDHYNHCIRVASYFDPMSPEYKIALLYSSCDIINNEYLIQNKLPAGLRREICNLKQQEGDSHKQYLIKISSSQVSRSIMTSVYLDKLLNDSTLTDNDKEFYKKCILILTCNYHSLKDYYSTLMV